MLGVVALALGHGLMSLGCVCTLQSQAMQRRCLELPPLPSFLRKPWGLIRLLSLASRRGEQ